MLSILTDLVNFNSNFESYGGTEFPELGKNIQQTYDTSNNQTLKQNESESFSGAL